MIKRCSTKCNKILFKEVNMYNYYYNQETQELTIYENSCVLATISNVDEKQTDTMFKDVVYELRGINL